MPQWMAKLAGHEFDLRALSALYTEPVCRVAKDADGANYLTRTAFEAMTEAGEVDKAARTWLTFVNTDMPLVYGDYEPIALDGILEVMGDGTRRRHILLSGVSSGRSRGYAELTVSSPDGQPRLSPEPGRAQARLRLAEREERVREAYLYAERVHPGDADCYSYAYKISEIILEDMGGGDVAKGAAAVESEGWSSADEMRDFTATVHLRAFGGRKARHAGAGQAQAKAVARQLKAGARKLSEGEVIACIRRVLRGWLDWKAAQMP